MTSPAMEVQFRCVVLIGREFEYHGPWHPGYTRAAANGYAANRAILRCGWATNWFVQDSTGKTHHQEPKAL